MNTFDATHEQISKDILEDGYSRLPKNIIGNDLYALEKDTTVFFQNIKSGNDVNVEALDKIIAGFSNIKNQLKSFKTGETPPPEYK